VNSSQFHWFPLQLFVVEKRTAMGHDLVDSLKGRWGPEVRVMMIHLCGDAVMVGILHWFLQVLAQVIRYESFCGYFV
jgi:hypothetical protein